MFVTPFDPRSRRRAGQGVSPGRPTPRDLRGKRRVSQRPRGRGCVPPEACSFSRVGLPRSWSASAPLPHAAALAPGAVVRWRPGRRVRLYVPAVAASSALHSRKVPWTCVMRKRVDCPSLRPPRCPPAEHSDPARTPLLARSLETHSMPSRSDVPPGETPPLLPRRSTTFNRRFDPAVAAAGAVVTDLIARAAPTSVGPHQLAFGGGCWPALMLPFTWRPSPAHRARGCASGRTCWRFGALGMWIARLRLPRRATTTALNIGLIYAVCPLSIALVLPAARVHSCAATAAMLALKQGVLRGCQGDLGTCKGCFQRRDRRLDRRRPWPGSRTRCCCRVEVGARPRACSDHRRRTREGNVFTPRDPWTERADIQGGGEIVGGPTVVTIANPTSFSMAGVAYRHCGTKVQF